MGEVVSNAQSKGQVQTVELSFPEDLWVEPCGEPKVNPQIFSREDRILYTT